MHGLKIQDGWCILYDTPFLLANTGLKSTYSVRISFNQAEDSKYEIVIPLE